jgi:hypothetical protein
VRSGKCLDLGRIHHAHRKVGTRTQKLGNRFPVNAGRFHTHVRSRNVMLFQKGEQMLKPFRLVLDHFVQNPAIRQTQGTVEFGFGDINSQMKCMHDPILLRSTLSIRATGKPGQRYCPISTRG